MKRIMKLKEVIERVGLSATTIWRQERKGNFPRRIRLGANSIGWDEGEIDAWLASRPRGMSSSSAQE